MGGSIDVRIYRDVPGEYIFLVLFRERRWREKRFIFVDLGPNIYLQNRVELYPLCAASLIITETDSNEGQACI